MNKEEIKSLLLTRVAAWSDSCNSYHCNHVEGQIRALVSIINDGKVTPSGLDVSDILKLAKIPYTKNEKGCSVDDEWLEAHGFTDFQTYEHPKFSGW